MVDPASEELTRSDMEVVNLGKNLYNSKSTTEDSSNVIFDDEEEEVKVEVIQMNPSSSSHFGRQVDSSGLMTGSESEENVNVKDSSLDGRDK